jgi:hypothetical protein
MRKHKKLTHISIQTRKIGHRLSKSWLKLDLRWEKDSSNQMKLYCLNSSDSWLLSYQIEM